MGEAVEALAYSSLWMAVQGWGDTDGETTAQVTPRGSEDLSQGRDQENHMEARQKSVSRSSVLIIRTEAGTSLAAQRLGIHLVLQGTQM